MNVCECFCHQWWTPLIAHIWLVCVCLCVCETDGEPREREGDVKPLSHLQINKINGLMGHKEKLWWETNSQWTQFYLFNKQCKFYIFPGGCCYVNSESIKIMELLCSSENLPQFKGVGFVESTVSRFTGNLSIMHNVQNTEQQSNNKCNCFEGICALLQCRHLFFKVKKQASN